MKHSQAEHYIREALWCVQHLISIQKEQGQYIFGEAYDRVAADLMPWVFHPEKTLLHPLLQLTERMDNGGQVTGMEFYNIMFVIWRWGDIINIKLQMSTNNEEQFPEPDPKWIMGWEPEEGAKNEDSVGT